jgi:hypothetical protein
MSPIDVVWLFINVLQAYAPSVGRGGGQRASSLGDR